MLDLSEDTLAIIVFTAGGGSFDPTFPITETEGKGNIQFDPDKDGGVWVWWSNDVTYDDDTDLTFIVPYDEDTGLIPPEGMDHARAWEVAAPYYLSETLPKASDPSDRSIQYTIKKRKTQDTVVRRTFCPNWYPDRQATQSATLVTTGFGAVDLGSIQTITESYNAVLSPIPIVCYGYSGAFCMDLGVSKAVSLNIIRTCPPLSECDDTSVNSKKWTNAKWISTLKRIMDRWQMMTNGSWLYLLRPKNERLNDGDPAIDPMREYYTEIDGERCYLTGYPVVYKDSPQTISCTIPIAIGTVYPQREELDRITVRFIGEGLETKSREYPMTRLFMLPDPSEVWGGNATGYTWTYENNEYHATNGGQVVAYENASHTRFDPKTVQKFASFLEQGDPIRYSVYAILTRIGLNGASKLITSTGTWKVVPSSANDLCIVRILAVGGGGGGGGCGRQKDQSPMSDVKGGGGGGSGNIVQVALTVDYGAYGTTGFKIAFQTIGAGGRKGYAGYYETDRFGHQGDYMPEQGAAYMNGGDGGNTIVMINDAQRLVAFGGTGGVGGSMGEKDGITGYAGGEGGTGYNSGGAGIFWTGDTPLSEAQANPGGGESALDGQGGYSGVVRQKRIGDSDVYIYAGGGGGGGAAYSEPGLEDSGNIIYGKASNGQAVQQAQIVEIGGRDTDVHTVQNSENSVTGRGAGGGGGGGIYEYRYASAAIGIGLEGEVYGLRGYDGKAGGAGWGYIVVVNGTIEAWQ